MNTVCASNFPRPLFSYSPLLKAHHQSPSRPLKVCTDVLGMCSGFLFHFPWRRCVPGSVPRGPLLIRTGSPLVLPRAPRSKRGVTRAGQQGRTEAPRDASRGQVQHAVSLRTPTCIRAFPADVPFEFTLIVRGVYSCEHDDVDKAPPSSCFFFLHLIPASRGPRRKSFRFLKYYLYYRPFLYCRGRK